MRETMGKKTICLITNWYPTQDNPFQGLFFKEQAFAVAEHFRFVIVHYNESIRKKMGKPYAVEKTNVENNTVEYTVNAYVPVSCYVDDELLKLKMKRHPENRVDGIEKYVSQRRKDFTRETLTTVFEKEIQEKIDILYCVDAQKEAYHVQCVAERFHIPYIVGEHAPVPWPGSLIADVNKHAIEKADCFLAISKDKIRQLMLQNIRLPKTVYIGNLVDEKNYGIRKEANAVKTFIIVAAYSFYKNYDMFIAVMDRLSEITAEPFKVMIVGYSANKGYSRNAEELEEKIRGSKFAKNAELIPFVPHESIGEVLCRADAFVMTSVQEGQPVSAMEAACCGLPIFSTRCGGVEDYVDASMGRIYGLTDVDAFAEGLKDFVEGKLVFDSAHIRKVIVEKFGKRAFVDTFAETFNGVINRDA